MAKKPAAPRVRMPWDQVALALHEISAVKAIAPEAMAVINKLCGHSLNPFTAGGPDGDRATTFGCGKLWVAHTLREVRELKMPGGAPAETGPHARTLGPEPTT